MTIQLTIYIIKWLSIDYIHSQTNTTIDYIHSQMSIQWLYTYKWLYTIDYTHNQMTIQLNIYIAKWYIID